MSHHTATDGRSYIPIFPRFTDVTIKIVAQAHYNVVRLFIVGLACLIAFAFNMESLRALLLQ